MDTSATEDNQSANTAPSRGVRPPAGRLVYLDVLRAVAILLVLGYHQIGELGPQHVGHHLLRHWGLVGWTGVDLFFVLSGFLIGGLLLNEYQQRGEIHVGRFYIRRGFKIWPSYILFISVITLYLAVLYRHSPALGTDGLGDVGRLVWPYFVHVQNYYAPLRVLIAHTWSLSVEEHFYLVLPVALLFCIGYAVKRGQHGLAAIPWIYLTIAFVCLAWRTANYCLIKDFTLFSYYFPTHLRIDSLMAGVFLAYLVRFRPGVLAPLKRHRWAIFVFSAACYLPAVLTERDSSAYLRTGGLTVLALGSVGLVLLAWFADADLAARKAAAEPGRPVTPPAIAGFLAWIGLYSYSIYLWHLPFPPLLLQKAMAWLDAADHPWTPLLLLLANIAISIPLGMLMYRLVERPALAVRDRFFPSRSTILNNRSSVPPVTRAPTASAVSGT